MIKNKNKIKVSSNKSFGIIFSVVFLILSIYLYIKSGSYPFKLISICIVFFILGILNSKILTPLNLIWFKFGIIISRIISPVIMLLIFFSVLLPISIITRIFKKDFLQLNKKKNRKKSTYWEIKKKYKNSMKDQF